MGLANKSVILYESIKTGTKWKLRPVDEDSSHFSNGPFYVSWYEGKKKQMEPAGRDPEHALRMAHLKRTALAYVSAGGEFKNIRPVKNPVQDSKEHEPENTNQTQIRVGGSKESEVKNGDGSETSVPDRKTVRTAISEYLEDCLDRQGKSGYGLASRTYEAYEYRLGFLAQFRPKAFVVEVDDLFLKAFRRFLREHPAGLSDRTAYNIMQAVSTFLLHTGNSAAKRVLKEMSFPPTIVIPYPKEQMRAFFAACDEKEELLYKFFLHSMAREMEVAHCEVRDLKFESNVLHISPKPDRNFRLKGKRSGQAKKGRKVPIPTHFMSRMNEYCADKGLQHRCRSASRP